MYPLLSSGWVNHKVRLISRYFEPKKTVIPRISNVPMFKCFNVQMFKCSNVQMFKCPNVQISIRLNFGRSVPPEFLRSFLKGQTWSDIF